YVVSAHKASSVTASVSGAFVAPHETNLVVAKGNRLEIHTQTSHGLMLVTEQALYGRITSLHFFHPTGRLTGLVLVTSDKQQFAVLSWDAAAQTLVTESSGEIVERTGRPAIEACLVTVDPESRMLAMYWYQGIVHLFQMAGGQARRGSVRSAGGQVRRASSGGIEEWPYAPPALAVLYEDANMTRQIHVYRVGEAQSEMQLVSLWTSEPVDQTVSHIVALTNGAVLAIGDDSVAVVAQNTPMLSMSMRAASVTAWEWIDREQGERLLLADDEGVLSLVVLKSASGAASKVKDLYVERMGEISVASSLTYLSDGCLYVGSHFGDQQLTTKVDADTFVEPLESFQNLAPIMDLCVGSGLASSSHGSIVTCSGMRNKPSLRMVRNGVGIDRIAGLDIKGLLGVWSFTARGTPDLEQVVLVLSLFNQTLVLGWTEPSAGREIEMNELDVGSGPQPGWRTSELTLAVGLTGDQNHVIQVTPTAVTLIGIAGWQQRAVWTPESGAPISVASVSGDQIAVVVDGKAVGYLEVQGTSIVPVALRELGQYVSCIDVHSWDRRQVRSSLVAIGLWGTNDIQLLQLPSLETHPLAPTASSGCDLPRSILMCMLGNTRYVLVGLGDGRLHHFAVRQLGSDWFVSEHKSVALGARPIRLTAFASRGSTSVFAAGDHSAVLFAGRRGAERRSSEAGEGKLMYANVDASEVMHVAPIASQSFPDALCLAMPGQLAIGTIDPVQKLHIRSTPLPKWAAPHRVVHNVGMGMFGLATVHSLGTPPVEAGRFSVVDAQTMDVQASMLLRPYELPESLCVASLAGLERTGRAAADGVPDVFVLGTSIVMPNEDDARRGRILAMQWDGQRMRLIGSFTAHGAVYAVRAFRGMVLAAVNNHVILLGWQRHADYELVVLYSQQTQIVTVSLTVSGDYVAAGDLMSSVSMYKYEETSADSKTERRLVPVTRDYASSWVTSVATAPAPLAQNLMRMFPERIADEVEMAGREHLAVEGRWHLGDMVNCMRTGSLVMDIPDPEFPELFRPALVFGTIHGAVGVIASVEDGKLGRILDRLQTNLAHLLPTAGMWSYDKWRAYHTGQRQTRAFGFLDGDLIERFLDLPAEMQELVVT
ncbi:hypothetical protein DL89DRAFT_204819, partial [Linderina pennispora]